MFEQSGSSTKEKSVPVIPLQVTSLLPCWRAPGLEHEISTTVPGCTGNSVVVSIVLVHPAFSPVQITGKFLSQIRVRYVERFALLKAIKSGSGS